MRKLTLPATLKAACERRLGYVKKQSTSKDVAPPHIYRCVLLIGSPARLSPGSTEERRRLWITCSQPRESARCHGLLLEGRGGGSESLRVCGRLLKVCGHEGPPGRSTELEEIGTSAQPPNSIIIGIIRPRRSSPVVHQTPPHLICIL